MADITPGKPRPSGRAELARGYLRGIDAAVAGALESLKAAGEEVTCARGCSWCCRLPLLATAPEAELAALYIRDELDGDVSAALVKRLDGWHSWCEGELAALVREGMDEFDAYALRGPGCPFLHDSCCVIYPVRPMGCRVHNSVSGPELCRPSEHSGDPMGVAGTIGDVLEAVKPLCMGYREALEQSGSDFGSEIGPFAELVRRMAIDK